jgi:hypothetical protein
VASWTLSPFQPAERVPTFQAPSAVQVISKETLQFQPEFVLQRKLQQNPETSCLQVTAWATLDRKLVPDGALVIEADFICRYWNSAFQPEKYNFAEYAISQGYSVFLYDRLGTGLSSK